MKRWIVVMAAAVLMVGPCFGQDADAARRAKVEELMTTMHIDKMMGQMTEMAKAQVKQSAQEVTAVQSMNPQQKKIYDDFQDKALNLVMESVSWKAIEPEIVKLYTDTFTEQEIDGIITFYKSPVGQSFLNKTPQLMSGMMEFMQGRVADLQPKIKALSDQFAKDMAAAGPTSKN